MYFGKPVHEAIIQYQNSEDFVERERLVRDVILPAMTTLAENIIHKYKHYNYGNRTYADARYECVVHLMDRLHKFQGDRGFKAFSYFDKIARNWVLADMRQSRTSIAETANFSTMDKERNVHNEIVRNDYEDTLRDFFDLWSRWGIRNVEVLFNGFRERQIAEAIFNLFKNCHAINIYEKKELYVLIREQVDVKTTTITNVVKKLKVLQKEMFFDFNENETRNWKKYAKLLEKPQNETRKRKSRRSPVHNG